MTAINDSTTGMGSTSTSSSGVGSSLGSSYNSKQPYKDIKASATDTFRSTDQIAEQIKKGAEQAQLKVKEYADVAMGFAQENPLYIALGAAGLGLLVGAFMARRRN